MAASIANARRERQALPVWENTMMKKSTSWLLPAALLAVPASAQQVGPGLTYDEAIRAAVIEQPGVQAGELQLQARQDAAEAADELPDPQLRAGIMNLPVTGPDFLDPTMMTQLLVGIEQRIPNRGKLRARTRMADAEIGLAQAQLDQTKYMARIASGRAWISLTYAQRSLVVADEALNELRQLVPVAYAAVSSGSARPAETLEIRRALLEVEDAITALEANREAAQALLVRYVAVENPVAAGIMPPIEVDPEQLRDTLGFNPQIVLANAAIQQARAEVGLAEAEKRPDFGVNVSYGIRERRFGDLFSVMGTVTLPLFGGRRQEPRIRAAEADAASASAVREDRLRELQAQFGADLAAWRSAYQQWKRAKDELLPLARDRVELETASFAAGRADLLDVIEAIKAQAFLELEILEREEAAVEAASKLRLTYTEQVQ
ncbi:TolC family protein [Erythrobacter sp. QSSC1-22B]|uniref:TolC family protein n=1 Tax=Erythrobacter sp. QSSC1-22B TaxID=1860125 RepID=UPI001F353660|nr:TolC family protein [Erythrobacter sp. QSSC1-22B]